VGNGKRPLNAGRKALDPAGRRYGRAERDTPGPGPGSATTPDYGALKDARSAKYSG
jgi:hypothetical protein